jgi:hypothetical protein
VEHAFPPFPAELHSTERGAESTEGRGPTTLPSPRWLRHSSIGGMAGMMDPAAGLLLPRRRPVLSISPTAAGLLLHRRRTCPPATALLGDGDEVTAAGHSEFGRERRSRAGPAPRQG